MTNAERFPGINSREDTQEEIRMKTEAEARMPEIVKEAHGWMKFLAQQQEKKYDRDHGAPNIPMRGVVAGEMSSLPQITGSTKLPFTLK